MRFVWLLLILSAPALADSAPIALKTAQFIRLLQPGQAGAAELGDFLAANPDWPDQAVLERRYGEALGDLADEGQRAALCARRLPVAAEAQLACAEALALAHRPVAEIVRAAWVAGLRGAEVEEAALARWAPLLRAADQEARFNALEPGGDEAAALRQMARLDAAHQAAGQARIALRHNEPMAISLLAAVPQAVRGDPPLLQAQARFFRKGGDPNAALALWRATKLAAEARGTWPEREALARDLLAAHQPQDAYFLADAHPPDMQEATEADFLAGWIALRFLHKPEVARAAFTALAARGPAAITQARAYYWLGRAADSPVAARADFARAAAYPLTFYGQAAARALGESAVQVRARIAAAHDPVADAAALRAFNGSELVQAARLLAGWGDAGHAADFLRSYVHGAVSQGERALAARLALAWHRPDLAVYVARQAGRAGGMLPDTGWPAPVKPPPSPVPRPLLLAVMRQESSFDPGAMSGSGAQGLMQLQASTAAVVARAQHIKLRRLVGAADNMRLGALYLASLLKQYDGVQAYALAAYNAGPSHVRDWLLANGDATVGGDEAAMIDWIEAIPFGETRNYVERVLENRVVYEVK